MRDRIDLSRSIVLGNCGSGKSWFSEKLSQRLGITPTDLDHIHWEPNGYSLAREKVFAQEMVSQAAAAEKWVIEGVYGWLALEAIARATVLFWLDLPVEECIDNLRRRGIRRGGDEASFTDLINWAEEYPFRETSSSQFGHKQIFTTFAGYKFRFDSRQDLSNFLSKAFT